MKGRKLLAVCLVLALCLGLAVPVLGAESTLTHSDFNDLMYQNPDTGDYIWTWAWPTIDDTLRRGLFIGYTPYQDEAGNTITNFGPSDLVTGAVGLTLCARAVVDADQRKLILNDRLEQMREIIPGTDADPDDPTALNMWFRKEAATCLELGVISADELAQLCDSNQINKPMTKADFAVYLIRAMGLEDFAKGLDATDLPFTDQASITRFYRPYVKLLYNYGVILGDEGGSFNPNQGMSRAVCATMLSRAMENILEEREVSVELPRYTDYPFITGIIKSVDINDDGLRVLTLTDLNGERTCTLPASAKLYQNNMPAKTTDLKTGSFAKLRLDSAGTVLMVRLIPAGLLTTMEGQCRSVDAESIVVDGVSYTLDRFTQVSAGGKVGDDSILDPDAGYTNAELVVNSRKQVLFLELSGGTRQVDGILTDVTTTTLGTTQKTTATVTSFNGLPTTYTLTDDVTVTALGQQLDELKASFKGRHVLLRVSDSDFSELKAVDVDLNSQYAQGTLELVNATANPPQVQITRTGEYKKTPYEVADDCTVTYEGKATLLKSLPTGTFVTVKLDGATVTDLSAWTGVESVSGTLDVVYGDPVLLTVTREDNTAAEFSIPLDELKNIVILVGDDEGDITSLHSGDSVTVTLRYRNITQINVTPRAADITGTLTSVTFNSDGSASLSVRLADGTVNTYTAAASATVTRDGNPVSMSELIKGVNQSVSLVTSGDRATTVQLSGAASAVQDSVEGAIISKDDQSRVAIILVPDEATGNTRTLKVHIPSGTTIIPASGGSPLTNISRLAVGDTILAFGAYGTDGVFEAASVVRK